MAKLIWDKTGDRVYETGISKGVLFPMELGVYEKGVVWNGLTSVSESPTGAEISAIYADNIKYLNLQSVEEFGATIEAFTYPEEFAECDGSVAVVPGFEIKQQPRKKFAFSYQTKVGNDLYPEAGYKIHIIYNALASPSERAYETVNDSPEAMTFSWEVSTTPVEVTGYKPTALVVIDSTKTDAAKLKTLEDKLYGTEAEEATLLLPDEIAAILGTEG